MINIQQWLHIDFGLIEHHNSQKIRGLKKHNHQEAVTSRAVQRKYCANNDANDSVITFVVHLSGAGVHKFGGHVLHV